MDNLDIKLISIIKIAEKLDKLDCSNSLNPNTCHKAKSLISAYKKNINNLQNNAVYCNDNVEQGPYYTSVMVGYKLCLENIEKSYGDVVNQFYDKFIEFDY